MKKALFFVLIGLIALGGAGCGPVAQQTSTGTPVQPAPTVEATAELPEEASHPAFQDAAFTVEETPVSLVNGIAESEAAPGSTGKVITRYFGNPAFGDLNGDGKEDVAFLITRESGGSGMFYYVVAALQTEADYQGTNAVLLGDRIAPQTTQIENGQIIVNYAERNPDEPFSVQPSIGVSKKIRVLNGKLVEGLAASPFATIHNVAVPASELTVSQNIDEISRLAGWTVKFPDWLPEGYQFTEALYDSANQMVIVTFTANRPLPGEDPNLTQTSALTLVQSSRNDRIPLLLAPGVDLGNLTIQGQPAAYAMGAWINDNAAGTATWDPAYPLQNINWQLDFTYLSLNTSDTLVSKEDLQKVAESVR